MPADFAINTEHKAVFSYGWGTLTFADVKDHRARLLQDPRFAADFRQIVLLSDVADLKISARDVTTLAAEPLFASGSRRALVAAPSLHFGLSRMFDAYSETQLTNVFRSLGEAAAWTDVPLEVAVAAFDEIRKTHQS